MRLVADLATIILAGSTIIGLMLRRYKRRSRPPVNESEAYVGKYKELYAQGLIDQDDLEKIVANELKNKGTSA